MMGYYTIALISILGAMSPGPDFVVVAKHAIVHDRQNAILASFGIGAGILLHVSYCVLGLAVVISESLLLFSVIKYLGAGYLIYLGFKSISGNKNHLVIKQANVHQSRWLAFQDGLLTNALNPKCTLFMLSVFIMVVKPATPVLTQVVYGLEIATIAIVWFVLISYGLTISVVKSKVEKYQQKVTKVLGIVLILLGLIVIFESH